MKSSESFKKVAEKAPAFAVRSFQVEDFSKHHIRGDVFITMKDGVSGEIQEHRELKNLVVMDASILLCRLMKDSQEPPHGIYALAIGTGDSGWGITPPAPTVTQRSLYSELARKTFTSTQFIDGDGMPTAIPTNVADFTTTYAESEAVGPLKEMGLIGGNCSTNMSVRNPVLPPNGSYDPSVNLVNFDCLINYLTFNLISKPATSTLAITWRLTF